MASESEHLTQFKEDRLPKPRASDKSYKANSRTALVWTWFTFWEGWLFGYFLGFYWAFAWFGAWILGRSLYELGRKGAL